MSGKTEPAPEYVCPIDGESGRLMSMKELREHLLTDHTLDERTRELVKMADPIHSPD